MVQLLQLLKLKGLVFKVKFLVATWKVGCLHRVAQLCKFNLQWNASYHFLSRVTEQSTKINWTLCLHSLANAISELESTGRGLEGLFNQYHYPARQLPILRPLRTFYYSAINHNCWMLVWHWVLLVVSCEKPLTFVTLTEPSLGLLFIFHGH